LKSSLAKLAAMETMKTFPFLYLFFSLNQPLYFFFSPGSACPESA